MRAYLLRALLLTSLFGLSKSYPALYVTKSFALPWCLYCSKHAGYFSPKEEIPDAKHTHFVIDRFKALKPLSHSAGTLSAPAGSPRCLLKAWDAVVAALA